MKRIYCTGGGLFRSHRLAFHCLSTNLITLQFTVCLPGSHFRFADLNRFERLQLLYIDLSVDARNAEVRADLSLPDLKTLSLHGSRRVQLPDLTLQHIPLGCQVNIKHASSRLVQLAARARLGLDTH